MVRNAFVTCQNNCRLVASVTECAVPGRITNCRSPFGSRLKNVELKVSVDEDAATGGNGRGSSMTSAQAADHILWMLAQSTDWSGHAVGFDDIAALGGPRSRERT